MEIIFCKSNTPTSWLVRLLTWGAWSHCGVITPSTTVIEAVWPRVKEGPLVDFLQDNGSFQAVHFDCKNEGAAINWLRSQVGKRYDLMALFGMLFLRQWDSPSKWFCSELVAQAMDEGGSQLFRDGLLGRITPQMLWMLHSSATLPPNILA